MNNPYIKRREQPTGGMDATACVRCGQFWSHNSGAAHHFTVITRYCPTCIATCIPAMGRAT